MTSSFYKRLLCFFALVHVCIPSIYSMEMSLSRITYNLLQINEHSLKLVLSTDSKEDVQAAAIGIGIHPFTVLGVNSLDPNFQVTNYYMLDGNLQIDVRREGSDTEPSEEWIEIVLSKGRENETYYSDFGEFAFTETIVINRSGLLLSDFRLHSGGWIYHAGDEFTLHFCSLPVRVVDRNESPVSNVLVVYELIGRAGIAMGRITNVGGAAEFIHPHENFFPNSLYPPREEIQSPYDYERFIENSSFVGKYVSNDCLTARFIVFPTVENASFSEPYTFARTLCFDSGEGFNFAEETLVLLDPSSGVEEWRVYP